MTLSIAWPVACDESLGRFGIGRFQRAPAPERAVELDRQPVAIVLHQRHFLVGVAALGVMPHPPLDRRLQEIDRRPHTFQRWLERTEGHLTPSFSAHRLRDA